MRLAFRLVRLAFSAVLTCALLTWTGWFVMRPSSPVERATLGATEGSHTRSREFRGRLAALRMAEVLDEHAPGTAAQLRDMAVPDGVPRVTQVVRRGVAGTGPQDAPPLPARREIGAKFLRVER